LVCGDNQINFYNKYLLLLEEYRDEQAGRVCGNKCGVVGTEKAITLRQGMPNECW
jgi:hypothetical protein